VSLITKTKLGLSTDMEAGLYAPDSEEEDGGSCGGRRQLYRRAVVPSMVKKMAEKMTMVPNLPVEMDMVADPAPEVAMAVDVPIVDPAPEVAPNVDVPVEVATAPDELLPEVKVQLARMEPILHGTFLSILKIYLPACFQP
jgi:hypothetical protein